MVPGWILDANTGQKIPIHFYPLFPVSNIWFQQQAGLARKAMAFEFGKQ